MMVTHDPRILDLADRVVAAEDGAITGSRIASSGDQAVAHTS
jgi:ABC-type lipoprotein export system ATPase subunit